VKYNTYIEAHKYWDTGITSEMIKGNYYVADKLEEILHSLAKTAYTTDYFEGKSIDKYFDDLISELTAASHEAQSKDGGSMERVLATADVQELIDEYIVKIVKDVADSSYFDEWQRKWNRAKELGIQGTDVNLSLTDEI